MFNTGGIDALTSKGRPGRGRKVKLERLPDLLVPVLENPRQAGELHWTGVKIHGWLKDQLELEVGYLRGSKRALLVGAVPRKAGMERKRRLDRIRE